MSQQPIHVQEHFITIFATFFIFQNKMSPKSCKFVEIRSKIVKYFSKLFRQKITNNSFSKLKSKISFRTRSSTAEVNKSKPFPIRFSQRVINTWIVNLWSLLIQLNFFYFFAFSFLSFLNFYIISQIWSTDTQHHDHHHAFSRLVSSLRSHFVFKAKLLASHAHFVFKNCAIHSRFTSADKSHCDQSEIEVIKCLWKFCAKCFVKRACDSFVL